MNASWSRNAFVYLLILVAGAALFFNIYKPDQAPQQISLSQLATALKSGQVQEIVVKGAEVEVIQDAAQPPVVTRREENTPLTETLIGLGVESAQLARVKISYEAPGNTGNWLALLVNLLPILFIAGLFFILFRQTQGSNNQAMSFGKSRARLFTGDKPTVTFDDVAGSDEAKQELEEIVEFLKEPQKFAALGAHPQRRAARRPARHRQDAHGESRLRRGSAVPFFSISGSEFVEMFVGVGASRRRPV